MPTDTAISVATAAGTPIFTSSGHCFVDPRTTIGTWRCDIAAWAIAVIAVTITNAAA